MDAYRSLWSFLARHDMVGEVRWQRAPRDDPAPEIWLEPRMLRHRDQFGFMFRVVYVAAALRQRRYSAKGIVTLLIEGGDALAPWNDGCWRVAAGPEGGDVTAVAPDGAQGHENLLRLSIKALGSLYIGHRTARELAAWGMIAASPAAVAGADAVFALSHAPHCAENF